MPRITISIILMNGEILSYSCSTVRGVARHSTHAHKLEELVRETLTIHSCCSVRFQRQGGSDELDPETRYTEDTALFAFVAPCEDCSTPFRIVEYGWKDLPLLFCHLQQPAQWKFRVYSLSVQKGLIMEENGLRALEESGLNRHHRHPVSVFPRETLFVYQYLDKGIFYVGNSPIVHRLPDIGYYTLEEALQSAICAPLAVDRQGCKSCPVAEMGFQNVYRVLPEFQELILSDFNAS
jgi:hypothetical protein